MGIGVQVIVILMIYFVGMGIMSIFGKKHATSFQNSITAGHSATLPLLLGGALGSHIGSGFVVGGAEYGASFGIGGAWYGIGCGISFLLLGFCFAGLIYDGKFLSLSDYFLERYESPTVSVICIITTTLSRMSLFAGQLLAGRAIFYVAGIDGNTGIVVTAVIALVYTMVSGLWGTMAVSLMQSLVIFLSISGALLMLVLNHGAGVLTTELPRSYFNMFPFGGEEMVMLTIPTILSTMISQAAFQRIASSKSKGAAVASHILSGLLLIVVAFIPTMIGMYGKAFYPTIEETEVFSTLAAGKLPPLLGALMLASIICAVISACSSVFLSISTTLIHDAFQNMLWPKITERQCQLFSAICNIAVCTIGVVLATSADDIIQLLALGYTFTIAGCFVPFVGGIIWKRGTAVGAISSALVGILFVLLDVVGFLPLPYASIFPLLPATITYIAASLLTGRRSGRQDVDI